MDYETCYVFRPEREPLIDERPVKKRRVGEYSGLHASWSQRQTIYNELWTNHHTKLKNALNELNQQTLSDVSDFIIETSVQADNPRLDSVILVTGPNLTSQDLIANQVHESVRKRTRSCYIPFSSGEANNLKAVLKRINAVTSSTDVLDDFEALDEHVTSGKRGAKLLNYDLRISQQAVEDQTLAKVVVAFQDCEAFDGSVLSDVIELLSCWKDRIPFVLMFGVATSIEALQNKLSRRAIRCLRGRRFDATNAEATLEDVFAAVFTPDSSLCFGLGFSSLVLARQRDFLANPQSIIDSVHYGYMSHFYANAISLFLDTTVALEDVPIDHFEAARNLPSFIRLAQDMLGDGKSRAAELRLLLRSDKHLFERIRHDVEQGQQTVGQLVSAARLYQIVASSLDGIDKMPDSEAILQALSGTLLESARLKTLFMVLRRATSAILQNLLARLETMDSIGESAFYTNCIGIRERLSDLVRENEGLDGPLRSEVDIQNSTLRTTVISKKISLSKAKTTLTKADAAYSEILNDFIEALQNYLAESLVDPETLPFNEIFLFNLKSPHRQTFTPRPRHAVERALSSPHDYLNCACCSPRSGEEDGESTLSASQPPTAILYQLYLESGLMINAADLMSAFAAILGEKVNGEEVLSVLFQRSLAELSYLGLVKGTKKKADHLLKTSWKGL